MIKLPIPLQDKHSPEWAQTVKPSILAAYKSSIQHVPVPVTIIILVFIKRNKSMYTSCVAVVHLALITTIKNI